MKKPTYKEQFDKLTEAYIAGEVNPLDSCACFIGNLLNGKNEWGAGRAFTDEYECVIKQPQLIADCVAKEAGGLYTPYEIIDMEMLFLQTISDWSPGAARRMFYSARKIVVDDESLVTEEDESALFHAFCVTLDRLKEIHISKGEVIDETPVFKKRVLTH